MADENIMDFLKNKNACPESTKKSVRRNRFKQTLKNTFHLDWFFLINIGMEQA